jgi:hypothetical protein
MTSSLSHAASILIAAPARAAFDFLADPIRLGNWSLGCMRTDATETPGVFTGHSLFDGAQGWFAIDADEQRLAIDYRVGPRDALIHRISARVMPGPTLGLGADECIATLLAWRPASMADERWARLCATHEAEMFLIKAQIETARS